MNRKQAFAKFESELHVSYSQIFTYLSCPLKFKYQYVEQRPQEQVSIALPFGSAIHSAIERYYRSIKEKGTVEPLALIQEVFQDHLVADLDGRDIPIIFKKETPGKEAAIEMGKQLLQAFYEGIDLDGFEVVDVELPLTARLYTDEGEPTDLTIAGIIDLVLKDAKGNIVAVDNKTAKQPYAQATVDEDFQMTCYSYLLASNRYVSPTAEVHCRFDVMRKLKKPKFEQHYTVRTAAQRRRFAKLVNEILAAIDAKVFYPNRGWMCGDCQFVKACEAW
jgi:putative RecB family exonuclease